MKPTGCISILLTLILSALFIVSFFANNFVQQGNYEKTADVIFLTNTAVEHLINVTDTARALTATPTPASQ